MWNKHVRSVDPVSSPLDAIQWYVYTNTENIAYDGPWAAICEELHLLGIVKSRKAGYFDK